MPPLVNVLQAEIEQLDAVIFASRESWAKSYSKAPKQHAKLIVTSAKLARAMRTYLHELAKRAPSYINWNEYNKINAAKVNYKVIFRADDYFKSEDKEILDAMYDPIKQAIALGAAAGEKVTSIPLGLNGQSEAIREAATGQIAQLIGKKISKDGSVVDNPNAKMNINDTTREKIERAIRDSLEAGETKDEATARILEYIDDPIRAETIAETESVNAYQLGQRTYAKETGAVGKEWQTVNAEDVCADNAKAGVIAIDDTFPSGDSEPAAHPHCLCNLRYVYAEEASKYGL